MFYVTVVRGQVGGYWRWGSGKNFNLLNVKKPIRYTTGVFPATYVPTIFENTSVNLYLNGR